MFFPLYEWEVSALEGTSLLVEHSLVCGSCRLTGCLGRTLRSFLASISCSCLVFGETLAVSLLAANLMNGRMVLSCLFCCDTAELNPFEKETDIFLLICFGFTYPCHVDVQMSSTHLEHCASAIVKLHIVWWLTSCPLCHTWLGFLALDGCHLSILRLLGALWRTLFSPLYPFQALWVLVLLWYENQISSINYSICQVLPLSHTVGWGWHCNLLVCFCLDHDHQWAISDSERFIYWYDDRGMILTPTPVSSLHLIILGLLPVTLPLQYVWNISTFVNACWLCFMDFLGLWISLGTVGSGVLRLHTCVI